jgi:ribose transport system ATP-binding protein
VDELAEDGLGVLLISSDLEELIEGSDRVVVLRDGAVVGELTGDDVTEDRLMEAIASAGDGDSEHGDSGGGGSPNGDGADASTDAGSKDAGSLNAGSTDAGSPDEAPEERGTDGSPREEEAPHG